MAAEVDVVASDFPHYRDVIESSKSGTVVDPSSAISISKGLETLLSDKEMLSQYGKNGKKAFLERYNWEKEEQKLLAFYEDILA